MCSSRITRQRLEHFFFPELVVYRKNLDSPFTVGSEIPESMLDEISKIALGRSGKKGGQSTARSQGRMPAAPRRPPARDRLFLPDPEEFLTLPPPQHRVNYKSAVYVVFHRRNSLVSKPAATFRTNKKRARTGKVLSGASVVRGMEAVR